MGKKKGQKAKKIHQRLKGMTLNRESQAGLYTERERGSKTEEGSVRKRVEVKKKNLNLILSKGALRVGIGKSF